MVLVMVLLLAKQIITFYHAVQKTLTKDQHALVKGKELTGFKNSEDEEVELLKHLLFSLEDELQRRGAVYKSKANWEPNVVVDGNDGRVVGKGTPAGVSESLSGELELVSGDGMVIPLGLSKADPSFVERALLAKGELPEPEKFRIADWVNLSVVEFEPLISMRELEAYAECGACPWDSTKSLWMIRLCSVNGRMISPVAKVVFDPEFVTSAHLVGGGDTGGGGAFKSEGFDSSQIFLYELETKTEGDQLGGFSITTNQGESGYLPILSPQQIKESPTVGFRVAVVLGGFARWAGSDTREKETLLRLAREARELIAREEVTDTSCRYALDVILQSEETLDR